MFKPHLDRLLLRKAEPEKFTASGLVIPDDAQGDVNEATVVAVGPKSSFKPGQMVLVGKHCGTEVEISKEKFVIVRDEDILGEL
jgi:chaperonin GroES